MSSIVVIRRPDLDKGAPSRLINASTTKAITNLRQTRAVAHPEVMSDGDFSAAIMCEIVRTVNGSRLGSLRYIQRPISMDFLRVIRFTDHICGIHLGKMIMKMRHGDKLRCSQWIINHLLMRLVEQGCHRRNLGTCIAAAIANQLATPATLAQDRDHHLRRQCHTDQRTCAETKVKPAMDIPGQVDQSSKADIRSPDTLHNPKKHQQVMTAHYVEAKAILPSLWETRI